MLQTKARAGLYLMLTDLPGGVVLRFLAGDYRSVSGRDDLRGGHCGRSVDDAVQFLCAAQRHPEPASQHFPSLEGNAGNQGPIGADQRKRPNQSHQQYSHYFYLRLIVQSWASI